MKNRILILLALVLVPLAGAEQRAHWELLPGKTALVLHIPEGNKVYASTLVITPVPDKAPSPSLLDGEKFFTGKCTWEYRSPVPEVTVQWQECAENGICYLPEEKSLHAEEKKTEQIASGNSARELRRLEGYRNKEEFLAFLEGKQQTKRNFLEGKGIFLLLLLTLAGGIALNFTPCVLPMIPVNLAILTAGQKTRKERIVTGLCYGAGIAAAYGLTGVLSLLGGTASSGWHPASRWYFNLGAGILFLLLGLSMFDLFRIDFTKWRNRFHRNSTGNAGVFLLGGVAALLAGACVAPVVIAVLLESARLCAEGHRSAALLPFVLGIGMGLPWPILAAGTVFLPKPGKWMIRVKWVLGCLILLLGIRYAVLGIRLIPSSGSGTKTSVRDLSAAVRSQQEDGKPVLIDFTADWCGNCKAMERNVLTDPEVRQALQQFRVIRFDATDSGAEQVKKTLKEYGVTGLPAFLILK